ncbi:AraC family transcriptional regulator [Paenibacillus nanensis]|uniref:AraC family transcriptional regulator n=1 Tax=Paenibacillus nanensis TaxID=393251 RepID=A0A3A1VJ65_9BACL|nr:AraC family transcriptional regulator [Paenibacillus nanensis]RIX59666.1 AraC family transcriptional regulator [Paenibacillus nanensis]
MKWNDHMLDGSILLNQKASYLKGNGIAATVYYWGAQSGFVGNKPHKHSFFEICYVLKGTGSYWEQEEHYPLEDGSLFLSRPGHVHHIVTDHGMDLLFMAFDIDAEGCSDECKALFAKLRRARSVFIPNAQELPVIRLWTTLLLMANEMQPLFHDGISGLGLSLITSVERTFADKEPSAAVVSRSSQAASLVYQAKLFIRDNLSQPLRLNDVAEHLHISSRHLSRLFLAELGQSCSVYIRKERIRKAGILLTETDLSIKDISRQTGFDTVHYFTSVFSAEMGMPPAKFKHKFQQLHH